MGGANYNETFRNEKDEHSCIFNAIGILIPSCIPSSIYASCLCCRSPLLVLPNILQDQRLALGFSHLVFLLQALFASQDHRSTSFALVPNS